MTFACKFACPVSLHEHNEPQSGSYANGGVCHFDLRLPVNTSKYQWRATEASDILFQAMKLVQKLPLDDQHRVRPVLERGFFWAHPEQLFRCGYRISVRGYVCRSVGQLVGPLVHWSVGP